jgi:hypothetical protein
MQAPKLRFLDPTVMCLSLWAWMCMCCCVVWYGMVSVQGSWNMGACVVVVM